MDRAILHCDCNNFFASVELLDRPELKGLPVAVTGDPENRHGIILAKNDVAKRLGVKTAETIWQARQKAPGLICLPSHHGLYSEFSKRINAIYLRYTDLVEPFSIDESYLDVTGSLKLLKMTPEEIADELRARVREEIGITISVGVSFCKIFAKMGSDYKKPDATTVIGRGDVERILYPLPVTDMLFVGAKTGETLKRMGIHTVGDLARADHAMLTQRLGAAGESLWKNVNGLDEDPVLPYDTWIPPKSVSHGMTFKRDIVGREEIRTGIAELSDAVSSRLRRLGMKGYVVSVQIKTPSFQTVQKQKRLDHPTWLQSEITEVCMDLFGSTCSFDLPVRLITVTVSSLIDADSETTQIDIFSEQTEPVKEKKESIEKALDGIRRKYGRESIQLGIRKNPEIGIDHSGPSRTEKEE